VPAKRCVNPDTGIFRMSYEVFDLSLSTAICGLKSAWVSGRRHRLATRNASFKSWLPHVPKGHFTLGGESSGFMNVGGLSTARCDCAFQRHVLSLKDTIFLPPANQPLYHLYLCIIMRNSINQLNTSWTSGNSVQVMKPFL
jgi:hypothetical protein